MLRNRPMCVEIRTDWVAPETHYKVDAYTCIIPRPAGALGTIDCLPGV